ncbi:MAG: ribulose-phosphate 3-epimerase [Candidatus Heimdallarchaeota archaeon]|nr:ribulose-phosphate 3-epimerase [Candidatus Heimdallarchaeota archaeon]
MTEISPSILSADFGRLSEEIRKIEDYVNYLHIDVMDGNFVPNLTIGPPVIKSIRKITNLTLDVHLMVTNPKLIIAEVIKSGADNITLHYESAKEKEIKNLFHKIHDAGLSCGLSINPKTSFSVLEAFFHDVDLILCMTVEPGFGGQSFIKDSLSKIREISQLIKRNNSAILLQVDGGINKETAPLVVEAGADILVAGSAIFGAPDPVLAIKEIQKVVELL